MVPRSKTSAGGVRGASAAALFDLGALSALHNDLIPHVFIYQPPPHLITAPSPCTAAPPCRGASHAARTVRSRCAVPRAALVVASYPPPANLDEPRRTTPNGSSRAQCGKQNRFRSPRRSLCRCHVAIVMHACRRQSRHRRGRCCRAGEAAPPVSAPSLTSSARHLRRNTPRRLLRLT